MKYIPILILLFFSCKAQKPEMTTITDLRWFPTNLNGYIPLLSNKILKQNDTIFYYSRNAEEPYGVSLKVSSFDGNLFHSTYRNEILHAELRGKTTIVLHKIDTFPDSCSLYYTKYVFVKKISKYESAYNIFPYTRGMSFNFDCTKITLSQLIDSIYQKPDFKRTEFSIKHGSIIVSSKVGDNYNYFTLNRAHGFYLIKEPYKNGFKYKKLYSKKVQRYLRRFNADRIPPVPLNKLVVPKKDTCDRNDPYSKCNQRTM